MSAKSQPIHGDGYQWVKNTISNPGAWSLVDPDGYKVAHAYRADDKTWTAVWDDGPVIAQGLAACGEALRRIDDVARPCAHVDTHPSHGIVGCDLDREPESKYCTVHKGDDDRPPQLNKGDLITLLIRAGKTVQNAEILSGKFVRADEKTITISVLDGLGQPHNVQRNRSRIERIEVHQRGQADGRPS
jgi:hypothetical protein